jgi:hypothetical protein
MFFVSSGTEENLISNSRGIKVAACATIILRRVCTSCSKRPSLTFEILSFYAIFSCKLIETPVYKNIAPSIAILVAIVVSCGRQVSGVFSPVL